MYKLSYLIFGGFGGAVNISDGAVDDDAKSNLSSVMIEYYFEPVWLITSPESKVIFWFLSSKLYTICNKLKNSLKLVEKYFFKQFIIIILFNKI